MSSPLLLPLEAPSLLSLVAAATFLLLFLLGQHLGAAQERRRLERLNRELEEQVSRRTRELEVANVALQELSLTDELTGLRNRRFLEGVLKHDLARITRDCQDYGTAPFALVFFLLDLDHFKLVNDNHGHAVGDQVLRETAALLRRVFRESDYLVRWGGEEFLVIVRYVKPAEAPLLAERMRSTVHEHDFELAGRRERGAVTCSIGYVVHPLMASSPDATSIEDVLQLADWSLYAAKRSGRNGWVGVSGSESLVVQRLPQRLAREPEALVDCGQLVLATCFEHVDLGVGAIAAAR